jgi:hypothetical protein
MRVTLKTTGDKCPACGTALAETGAPIWESYCPNDACTYEREQFYKGVRETIERREREEYERLKAKYSASEGRLS